MRNELFKNTPKGVLIKCLSEAEVYMDLSNVHGGACGAHHVGQRLKLALVSTRDVLAYYVEGLHRVFQRMPGVQRHADIQHVPARKLHFTVNLFPFRGWALDLVREIRPTSSKNHKYILVAIDYFTKWIKVIPLVNVDQDAVIEFIQSYIIYRFGIP